MQQIGSSNRGTIGRLGFLDWTRGFAVLIILQGHVFHSFSTPAVRNNGPYVISQFFGGLAPAIFLLLTGVTLGFIMARGDREGLSMRDRWWTALRRSRYLFLLAFLFRLQLFIFGFPSSPAPDILKVDVLNCMGFAFAMLSPLALLSTVARARTAAILGAVIAFGAPLVSMLNWNWLPPRMAAYIIPSLTEFGLFPWAAFIAFGLSVGSILRLTKPEQLGRAMQWIALAGFAIFLAGQYCSNFPYSIYPHPDFWLNSPWMIAMKLGPVLLLLSAAYLWNEYGSKSWSPLRQFGVTSLLVYWVHIELVYGRWFWFLKDSLSAVQCALCAVILIALMLGLSVLRTRYKGRSLTFSLPYFTTTQPRRIPGD